jgi:hypothetical protein
MTNFAAKMYISYQEMYIFRLPGLFVFFKEAYKNSEGVWVPSLRILYNKV